MNYIEGNLIAQGLKIGIAAARFNEFIVSKLVSGAEDGLQRHGVKESDLSLIHIFGAMGVDSILLEGGATLNDAALRAGIVQEVVTFICPN